MPELKTKVNNASVKEFIENLADEQRKQDSLVLLKMHEEITNEPAKMWGPSIVGFGKYTYKSGNSNKENEMPLAAFSPRKQYMTLYVMPSWGHIDQLLEKLGKHSTSKACLYIEKLSEIDLDVLREIIELSYEESKKRLL